MCVHLFIATHTARCRILSYLVLSSPGKCVLPIYCKRKPEAGVKAKVRIVGNVLCNKLNFNMRNTWIATVAVLSINWGN